MTNRHPGAQKNASYEKPHATIKYDTGLGI